MSFSKLAFHRLIAPALLGLLALGCDYYNTYAYVGYPSAALRTCDQPCGDGVSECSIVSRCDAADVGDPEGCQMAAQDLQHGEVIIECTVEHVSDSSGGL